MEHSKIIGHNLTILRKARTKLTQSGMAHELGCTRDMIYKIEAGQSELTMARLLKLCQVLDCTPNLILKGTF